MKSPGTPVPGRQLPEIVRLLLGLGIDYLRWLLFMPMIVVWGLYLLMVVVMLYANFEGSIWSLAERGYETYRDRFGPVAWIEGGPETEQTQKMSREVGSDELTGDQAPVHFTLDDLIPWFVKVWVTLALAGWVIGMLRSAIFGPRPPRSLGNKLKWMLVVALVSWVLLWIAYFSGGTNYEGSILGWFALYTGSVAIVIAVSTVVLGMAEMVDHFRTFVVTGKLETVRQAAPDPKH